MDPKWCWWQIFEIIKDVLNRIKITKKQLKLDLDIFENEYLNNVDSDINMKDENN